MADNNRSLANFTNDIGVRFSFCVWNIGVKLYENA